MMVRPRNSATRQFVLFLSSIILVLLLLLPISVVHSYRIGDAIDTEIVLVDSTKSSVAATAKANSDLAPKRNQLPIFGIDTITTIGPLMGTKFVIRFEDGAISLPYISPRSLGTGSALERVIIEFVHGSGEIHSLSHQTVYSKDKLKPSNGEVSIEYKWIEIESVDYEGGAFVMFLSVFITSIYFLLDLCGLCDNNIDGDDDIMMRNNHYSGSGSINNNSSSTSSMNYIGGDNSDRNIAAMGGGGRIPKYE